MEKKKLENRCSEFVSLKVCRNRCGNPEECPSYKSQLNTQKSSSKLIYSTDGDDLTRGIYGRLI